MHNLNLSDFGPSHIRICTLKELILIRVIILVCIMTRLGWGTSCWGVQPGDTSWPTAAQHSPPPTIPPPIDTHQHTLTFRLRLAFTHHLFPRLPPTCWNNQCPLGGESRVLKEVYILWWPIQLVCEIHKIDKRLRAVFGETNVFVNSMYLEGTNDLRNSSLWHRH